MGRPHRSVLAVRPLDHAMPLWMQILAVVIGASILVVQMLMRSERRGWRRVESWRCPEPDLSYQYLIRRDCIHKRSIGCQLCNETINRPTRRWTE